MSKKVSDVAHGYRCLGAERPLFVRSAVYQELGGSLYNEG